MTEILNASGFNWDDGNRVKCTRHGLTIDEIESVFLDTLILLPDHDHSETETRMRAIGSTATGRKVFIVFTLREHRGQSLIRPISARYMHAKEITHYEKESSGL